MGSLGPHPWGKQKKIIYYLEKNNSKYIILYHYCFLEQNKLANAIQIMLLRKINTKEEAYVTSKCVRGKSRKETKKHDTKRIVRKKRGTHITSQHIERVYVCVGSATQVGEGKMNTEG